MADFLTKERTQDQDVFTKHHSVVAQAFHVNENKIICPHCRHDHFKKDQVQIDQAFCRLVSAAKKQGSLFVLICENCSNIQWFCNEPEQYW